MDELRGHPDAVPGSAHAAFQDVLYSQRLGDFGDVLLLAAERERGSAGNHLQARNFGEQVQDFFGQPVAEVFVLFVRAHVGEGQDRDGRLSVRTAASWSADCQRCPHLRHALKAAAPVALRRQRITTRCSAGGVSAARLIAQHRANRSPSRPRTPGARPASRTAPRRR